LVKEIKNEEISLKPQKEFSMKKEKAMLLHEQTTITQQTKRIRLDLDVSRPPSSPGNVHSKPSDNVIELEDNDDDEKEEEPLRKCRYRRGQVEQKAIGRLIESLSNDPNEKIEVTYYFIFIFIIFQAEERSFILNAAKNSQKWDILIELIRKFEDKIEE
jgi:hypothetical protein